MSKSAKHYLENGEAYDGPVHKMGEELHTGAEHSAKSQKLTHSKDDAKKSLMTRAADKK
jgi:hypothetical protein